MSVTEHLSFACSVDASTSEMSVKFLVNVSYLSPKTILEAMEEIKFTVEYLCECDIPRWSAISSLVFAVANAVKLSGWNLQEMVCEMVKMSKIISLGYFRSRSDIRPNLKPLVDVVINSVVDKKIQANSNILVAVAEHCAVGFIPGMSLMPMITSCFDTFSQALSEARTEDYAVIAEPLGNVDADISSSFVVLWFSAIPKMTDRTSVVHALTKHVESIVDMKLSRDSRQMAAVILFDYMNSELGKSIDMHTIAKTVIPKFLENSKKIMAAVVAQTEIQQPREKEKTYKTYRADVQMRTKAKKKWSPVSIIILEEAGVIMWTKSLTYVEKGNACPLSGITDLSVVNIDGLSSLKLVTAKGEFYFNFKTDQEMEKWRGIIKGMRE